MQLGYLSTGLLNNILKELWDILCMPTKSSPTAPNRAPNRGPNIEKEPLLSPWPHYMFSS